MTGRVEAASGRQRGGTRIMLSGSSSLETPAERALDRVVRSGHPASVLRLYLSRLHRTRSRPYHGRVARCLFDDAVQHGGGQVFACRNGDPVLIAGPEPVAMLGVVLLRLFRAEAPGERHLLGLWSLPTDEAAVRAEFIAAGDAVAAVDEPPAPLGAIAAVATLLASAPLGELVSRQSAVRIDGGRMIELFQELSVSLAAVESRIGMQVPDTADPYLVRYLTGQLDGCMLGSLAASGLSGAPSLTVNLPLASLESASFETFRLAAAAAGTRLGMEIALVEAMVDMRRFRAVRDRIQGQGCFVVLDGIDHHALLHCDLAGLQADWLKLAWSPVIPALPPREQRRIRTALEAVGTRHVIVQRADTEAALVWGLGQGIGQFQGRHVDLMLTAARLRNCAHGASCSLRECIDRGTAAHGEGQRGCLAPALLGGAALLPATSLPAGAP